MTLLISGWLHVYQTFGCLALICVISCLILMILYMFIWKQDERLRKAIISAAFASGIRNTSLSLSLYPFLCMRLTCEWVTDI